MVCPSPELPPRLSLARMLLRFDLLPGVAAAACDILACAVLGHHAGFRHRTEERQTALFHVITERQARNLGKDLPKDLLSPDQGQTLEIVPVQVKDVKDLINQMADCAMASVVLQRLKT